MPMANNADFVVNALDHLSHKADINKRCFHLVDPVGYRVGDVLDIFSRAAHAPKMNLFINAALLGFIPKSSSNEVLKHALQLVLAGGVYIPPQVFGGEPGASTAPVSRGLRSPAEVGLTGRQAQILALLMRGEPNKVIGRELGLAESTVKNQVTAILKALEVTSRTQAVLAVERLGLALPESNRPRR